MTSYVPIGGVKPVGRKRTYQAAAAAVLALSVLVPGSTAQASFPGANGFIYFEAGKNIYRVDETGGNRQLVARSNAFGGTPSPDLNQLAVSPNGKKIAFSTADAIWVGTVGGGANEITDPAAKNLNLTGLQYPAFSPTGKKIVFQAVKKQNGIFYARLYRINTDGTGLKQIIRFNQGSFGIYQTNPDWSVDNEIVYAALDDLWIINPDGSGNTNLTNDFNDYFNPSWSPDGNNIAVEHELSGGGVSAGRGIVSISRATGDATAITGNAPDNDTVYMNPSWSPDGSKVAFDGFKEGSDSFTNDIYTVTVAGATFDDLDTIRTSGLDSEGAAWAKVVPVTP